jgi:hypothetical protein
MEYDSYCKKYFVDNPPQPGFEFTGLHGAVLYFSDYTEAIAFYQRVLGPPAYVEGDGTHGWQIGNTWLTLLKGQTGNPQNVEVLFVMSSLKEAERLQAAFIEAGGMGESPTDQLMYEPVRYCPVIDPFGTNILIICPLAGRWIELSKKGKGESREILELKQYPLRRS